MLFCLISAKHDISKPMVITPGVVSKEVSVFPKNCISTLYKLLLENYFYPIRFHSIPPAFQVCFRWCAFFDTGKDFW